MTMKARRDFFILRGDLIQNGKQKDVHLHQLGVITGKYPSLYGIDAEQLQELTVKGYNRKDNLLFALTPYRRENSSESRRKERFIVIIPYTPELNRIDIVEDNEILGSLDKQKPAEVEFDYAFSKAGEGVDINIQATYDFLQVRIIDTESASWRHVYVDNIPKEAEELSLPILWPQFPIAKTAVIEVTAINGLHVKKILSKEINVELESADLKIDCVGFRLTGKQEKNQDKNEGENDRIYEFVLTAQTILHGIPLDSVCSWKVHNKTYTGKSVKFTVDRPEPFTVFVTTLDHLEREVAKEYRINPEEFTQRYFERMEDIQQESAERTNTSFRPAKYK